MASRLNNRRQYRALIARLAPPATGRDLSLSGFLLPQRRQPKPNPRETAASLNGNRVDRPPACRTAFKLFAATCPESVRHRASLAASPHRPQRTLSTPPPKPAPRKKPPSSVTRFRPAARWLGATVQQCRTVLTRFRHAYGRERGVCPCRFK